MRNNKNICPHCMGYMTYTTNSYTSKDKYLKCLTCAYMIKDNYMISMKEILKNRVELSDLPQEHQDNLKILHERINVIREKYGKPLIVNDGYRRPQDAPKHGSTTSWHFKGAAIDLDDNIEGTFWNWLMQEENMQLLKDTGLWLEHGNYTHNKKYGTWVHLQIYPPKSGKRIFIPSAEADPNPGFWDGSYDPQYN